MSEAEAVLPPHPELYLTQIGRFGLNQLISGTIISQTSWRLCARHSFAPP